MGKIPPPPPLLPEVIDLSILRHTQIWHRFLAEREYAAWLAFEEFILPALNDYYIVGEKVRLKKYILEGKF